MFWLFFRIPLHALGLLGEDDKRKTKERIVKQLGFRGLPYRVNRLGWTDVFIGFFGVGLTVHVV